MGERVFPPKGPAGWGGWVLRVWGEGLLPMESLPQKGLSSLDIKFLGFKTQGMNLGDPQGLTQPGVSLFIRAGYPGQASGDQHMFWG